MYCHSGSVLVYIVFKNHMMPKLNFSSNYLNPQSHDPSEIIRICWFSTQETFLIITVVKTVVLLNIFCGKRDKHFLGGLFDE